jgi:hypothetical protein
MELDSTNGLYLINPREIRMVKYYISYEADGQYSEQYSPTQNIDNLIKSISNKKLNDEYFKERFSEICNDKDKLTEYIRSKLKKYIEIEMYDKTNEEGKRERNILKFNVYDDKVFNYIYKNLARKFNLKVRDKNIKNDNIKKNTDAELIKEMEEELKQK